MFTCSPQCFCLTKVTLKKFKIDNPESLSVSVPCKRFLGNYCQSYHQTWHGDCLRHKNAPFVNYNDLDLHSKSHLNYENDKGLIISVYKQNKGKELRCWLKAARYPAVPVACLFQNPWDFLPAVRLRDLDFENMYKAWPDYYILHALHSFLQLSSAESLQSLNLNFEVEAIYWWKL